MKMAEHSVVPPGSYLYTPADVPRPSYNPSAIEEAVAVIARTDPNAQESVVLLPELDTDAARDA